MIRTSLLGKECWGKYLSVIKQYKRRVLALMCMYWLSKIVVTPLLNRRVQYEMTIQTLNKPTDYLVKSNTANELVQHTRTFF